MNKSKYSIQQAKYFLLLSISFFIPFYKKIVPPLIILWFALSLLDFTFENFRKSKHKPLFYSIVGYFILLVTSLLWTKNMYIGVKEIEAKLSLIIFPIGFAFASSLNQKMQSNVLKSFILGNAITILIQLVFASFRFWTQTPELHESPTFFFTYVEFSYFTHPSYASMFSLFSIISIFYLIIKQKEQKKWLFLYIIFIPSIYLYASKAGFLVAFLTMLIFSVYFIIKYKKIILTVASLFFLFSIGIILYKNHRVQILFKERKINIAKSENSEKTDTRIILWQLNIELIKKNILLGTGVGDYKDEMVKIYKKINYQEAIDKMLDSHNQFIKSFAVLGIFGFINMLSIFIISFYNSVKERNLYTFLFVLILFINFLFESMLIKQSGVVFFGFFFSFLFFMHNDEKVENQIISN